MISPWRDSGRGTGVVGVVGGCPFLLLHRDSNPQSEFFLPKTPATFCHLPLSSQGPLHLSLKAVGATEKREMLPPNWSLCDLAPVSSKAGTARHMLFKRDGS